MPVNEVFITPDQRQRILQHQEGHYFDLKAIDVSPSKLTKTISAFANTDGGELFIGVDEDKQAKIREWRGFPNQEAANGHLQIFEKLFPLGRDFTYTFLRAKGEPGLLLQVEVHRTSDIKVASDGTPYIRRGAQSLPVQTKEELDRLRWTKGISSFETEAVPADLALVTNSTPIISFMLDVIPTAEPEDWLRKQQLVRDGNPTVAGVVLFAEEPQAILPKRCAIKVYRYKTREAGGTRETLVGNPLTIEGCLYDQIKEAVQTTVEMIEGIPALGSEGFQKVEYPVVTLHEILTNAVLHRDYSIADDVHVRVFDNRVEVESPGRLPAHITVDNILSERFARNGNIVRIINKFPDPPNKDVGEGLNTAFAAMRKLRLRDPQIVEQENSVLVIIRHERLASAEDIVMEYLSDHHSITNGIARGLCGIDSENTMKNVFYRLRDRNLIERVPGLLGPQAAWRKLKD